MMTDDKRIEENTNKIDYEFKTLSGYGKFISGFGWIMAFLGIIASLLWPTRAFVGVEDPADFGIILGGVIALVIGIGLVVNGQLISCFVSIEKNTRQTYKLLQQKKVEEVE